MIREHAPKARDFTNRRCRHRGVVDEVERAKNRFNVGFYVRIASVYIIFELSDCHTTFG